MENASPGALPALLLPVVGSDESYTVAPTKIIALGLNYRDHIAESPSVKVRGFTTEEPRTDYEAELALIVKTECKNVPESDALTHVLGYTGMNDVIEEPSHQEAGREKA